MHGVHSACDGRRGRPGPLTAQCRYAEVGFFCCEPHYMFFGPQPSHCVLSRAQWRGYRELEMEVTRKSRPVGRSRRLLCPWEDVGCPRLLSFFPSFFLPSYFIAIYSVLGTRGCRGMSRDCCSSVGCALAMDGVPGGDSVSSGDPDLAPPTFCPQTRTRSIHRGRSCREELSLVIGRSRRRRARSEL